jgi:hypothetical protein
MSVLINSQTEVICQSLTGARIGVEITHIHTYNLRVNMCGDWR